MFTKILEDLYRTADAMCGIEGMVDADLTPGLTLDQQGHLLHLLSEIRAAAREFD